MFEAVNSVISNAPFLRNAAEQVSSARDINASKPSVPEAPYISPYVHLDTNYDKAVIQIRDSDTGDVLKQFPSQETLAQRARQAESDRRQSEAQATSQQQRQSVAIESSEASVSQFVSQSNIYVEAQQIASSGDQSYSSAPSSNAVSSAISSASSAGESAPSQVSISA